MEKRRKEPEKKAYLSKNAAKGPKPPVKKAAPGKNGCAVYKKCGGCQLANLTYPEQLSLKQGTVIKLLGKFGHVERIIGMENPTHYRSKVQTAFALDRSRRIIAGVYQSADHRVVATEDCALENKDALAISATVKKLMKDFKIVPYDEVTGRGNLRHILVKKGFFTGQLMVVLVTATPILPDKNHFVKALLAAHPSITTVIHNINPKGMNLTLGPRDQILYGPGTIEDLCCGLKFRISPRSFYQVNPVQTEVLYRKALEFAALDEGSTVIDAYCGVGTIGLIASKQAGRVIGIELNSAAVADANCNKALNGIENADFYCGDAGEVLTDMAGEGFKADVLLMDPPRAGSTPEFLKAAAALSPSRIVYISCNPETQARDLGILVKSGYQVKKIQPVDMFPHTGHVECVVLLSRK